MNAFLNALKTKSAQVKQDNQKHISNNKLENRITFDNGSYVDLESDNTPKIERVTNRNRIDLFFPNIPSEDIRTQLKNEGFRFDGDRKAWYHQDNLSNRLFLNELFNANFEGTQPEASKLEDMPTESEICEPNDTFEPNDPWKKYKFQVQSLIHELKLDAADLQLEAINKLYEFTFKSN